MEQAPKPRIRGILVDFGRQVSVQITERGHPLAGHLVPAISFMTHHEPPMMPGSIVEFYLTDDPAPKAYNAHSHPSEKVRRLPFELMIRSFEAVMFTGYVLLPTIMIFMLTPHLSPLFLTTFLLGFWSIACFTFLDELELDIREVREYMFRTSSWDKFWWWAKKAYILIGAETATILLFFQL